MGKSMIYRYFHPQPPLAGNGLRLRNGLAWGGDKDAQGESEVKRRTGTKWSPEQPDPGVLPLAARRGIALIYRSRGRGERGEHFLRKAEVSQSKIVCFLASSNLAS